MTDDGAEELAQPPPRVSARRLRLDLALGAAVLVGIVLLTRPHGNGTGGGSPPTPTATAAASTPPQTGTAGPAVYPAPYRHVRDVASCPDGSRCQRFAGLTLGTKAALEAAFPGVRVLRARTVRIYVTGYGTAVWTSDIRARAGDQLVHLQVQPGSPEDGVRHRTTLFGGHSITHWETALHQARVLIEVVAPADRPASLAAVGQLAHDARLLSPW